MGDGFWADRGAGGSGKILPGSLLHVRQHAHGGGRPGNRVVRGGFEYGSARWDKDRLRGQDFLW